MSLALPSKKVSRKKTSRKASFWRFECKVWLVFFTGALDSKTSTEVEVRSLRCTVKRLTPKNNFLVHKSYLKVEPSCAFEDGRCSNMGALPLYNMLGFALSLRSSKFRGRDFDWKTNKIKFWEKLPWWIFSGPGLFFSIWLKMTKQSNILVAGLSKKLQVQLITF